MLQETVVEFIFHFMLIFSRFAAAFGMFPGLGDRTIPNRIRLVFTVVVSIVIYPVVSYRLPYYSENFALNVSCVAIEIFTGLVISIAAKIYFLCLNVMGNILAMQSGLGAATFFDPTQSSQVAIFSSLLTIVATATIFATDTHHLFLYSVVGSYEKFAAGELLNIGDVSQFVSYIVNDSFVLAFKITAPFLIISILMLVGSGVLSRLMPNFQVFFILTPVQILVLLAILYITVNAFISKVIDTIANSLQLSI